MMKRFIFAVIAASLFIGGDRSLACTITPTMYAFGPASCTKYSNMLYVAVQFVNTSDRIWDAEITAGGTIAKIVPGYESGTMNGIVYIETAYTDTTTTITVRVTCRTTIAGSPATVSINKTGPTTAQVNYWPTEQGTEFYAGQALDPIQPPVFYSHSGPPR